MVATDQLADKWAHRPLGGGHPARGLQYVACRYGWDVTTSRDTAPQQMCPLCLRDLEGGFHERMPAFSSFFRTLVGAHPGTTPLFVDQPVGPTSITNKEGSLALLQVANICTQCQRDFEVNVERPSRPVLDRIVCGPKYTLAPYDFESLSRWALATTLLAISAEPQSFCANTRYELQAMIDNPAVPESTALYGFGMHEGHVAPVLFRSIVRTDLETSHCDVLAAALMVGVPHLALVSLYGSTSVWLHQSIEYFEAAAASLPHTQLWPANSPTTIPIAPELTTQDAAAFFLATYRRPTEANTIREAGMDEIGNSAIP
jgi:hypothetical protein